MSVLEHPNATRYAGDDRGHYESFFQRANHPSRPLAFWIRYTIFSPAGRPESAVGELWAIWFDGETNRHVALKHEVGFADCEFGERELFARVGDAELSEGWLNGSVNGEASALAWDLQFAGDAAPVLLLPEGLYEGSFPKAKALVPRPMARYSGSMTVNGERIAIDDWVGSQNHNWGSKHTDSYAWGQVAGFGDGDDTFLEVATARIKVGPIWSPRLTPLVVRHGGREIALNGLGRAVRNRGRFAPFHWEFSAHDASDHVHGRIEAPADAFVGLAYANPPGGTKHCLNSKIASCELTLNGTTLRTSNRAAFEMLVDPDSGHGVPIRA